MYTLEDPVPALGELSWHSVCAFVVVLRVSCRGSTARVGKDNRGRFAVETAYGRTFEFMVR